MIVRRVVTGRRAEGTSVFVSDTPVDPIEIALAPGTASHRLWGSDVAPHLPTDGTPPEQPDYFPPASGHRFGLFTLAPASTPAPEGLDMAAALAEVDEKLPGMFDVNERDNPGMHTTATVDFDMVLSGEVWLELDGGAERMLRAGDCVIQNGTRHAWHNRSDAPCVMLVVLLGAELDS
jgi:mannose-6-phosphate isomerase-like protein (cupin superfamily)